MQCLQFFLLLSFFKKKIFSTTRIVYFDFSKASCHCFMYFNFKFFLRSNKSGKKKPKKPTKTKSASKSGRVQLLPSPSPRRGGVGLRGGGERYRGEGDAPGSRWGAPAACRGTGGPRGRGGLCPVWSSTPSAPCTAGTVSRFRPAVPSGTGVIATSAG